VCIGAKAGDPANNAERKDNYRVYERIAMHQPMLSDRSHFCEDHDHVRYHPKRSPFSTVRVGSLYAPFATLKTDFPPVLRADGDITSRPEE